MIVLNKLLNMSCEYQFTLSEEIKQYAKETLGETKEAREKCVNEIQTWLRENPSLHGCKDPTIIVFFLRGCKFDLERTKRKLLNYYTIKAEAPEWFTNRDPTSKTIQELVKLGAVVPLQEFMDDRVDVIIIRMHVCDPRRFHVNDVIKIAKMVLDVIAIENEQTTIFGITGIIDLSKIRFGLVKQMTPGLIRKVALMAINDHWRLNRLEFINVPFYMYFVINIFKAFLSNKLRSRIVISKNLEALYKHVDQDILPLEYGGSCGKISDLMLYWLDKLVAYKNWYKNDEKYKADVS